MNQLVELPIGKTIFSTNPNKRLPQFILALDRAYYDVESVVVKGGGLESLFAHPINRVPHELFCDNAQSYLTIREREYLDEATQAIYLENGTLHAYVANDKGEKKKGDPSYKQLLPYMVARQLQQDGTYVYFPYRRTKKVGEQRLAGNGSLGYGGHIDLQDVVHYNSVIDLKATILASALREAMEEFTMYDLEGDEVAGLASYQPCISFGDLFIVDDSNDVGELHLGIIMYFDVPTGYRLEATEDELAKLPPMNAEQMRGSQDFNPENWTSIFLKFLAFDKINKGMIAAGLVNVDVGSSPEASVVSIDHGGVKVGEIDESYFTSVAVPNYVPEAKERMHISIDVGDADPAMAEQVIENVLMQAPTTREMVVAAADAEQEPADQPAHEQ